MNKKRTRKNGCRGCCLRNWPGSKCQYSTPRKSPPQRSLIIPRLPDQFSRFFQNYYPLSIDLQIAASLISWGLSAVVQHMWENVAFWPCKCSPQDILFLHNHLINFQDSFRTIILYLLTFKSLPHSYPGGSQLWCNTWGDMALFGHVSAPLKIFYFSTTT